MNLGKLSGIRILSGAVDWTLFVPVIGDQFLDRCRSFSSQVALATVFAC